MENKAFDYSHYADWRDPNEVIPYAKNAKTHTEKQIRNIANSIRRFGWQQDTVITRDNVLVIGHGRRLAAIQLGCMIPFHVINKNADELTDEDIRELRIADNATNAETGIDFAILEDEIGDLSFEGFEFDFLPDEQTDETQIIEDEAPPVPEIAKTKLGQIYQLGRHRLMCGDSTDPAVVEKLMGGAKADLFLTDPPYNVSVGDCERPNSSNNGVHIMNDSMSEKTLLNFYHALLIMRIPA